MVATRLPRLPIPTLNGNGMMTVLLDPSSVDSYQTFLRIKSLPVFRIRGRMAEFPAEYADRLGLPIDQPNAIAYQPQSGLYDYQRDISALAIRKRKFGVFARPGLGKTFILAEFARNALEHLPDHRKVLLVSPLMVCPQTIAEINRFYGDSLPIEHVHAANLQAWLDGDGQQFGITNFEAIRKNTTAGKLGALLVDEMLKDMYGQIVKRLTDLGRGLEWKMLATGTPAPNDRTEYGTHAVFLDQSPTINAFLSKYFVNRGQTQNRWELRPHALRPFYRDMSHWCIFLSDPATYGWKDNCNTIPPIHTHIHEVPLTQAQRDAVFKLTGQLCVTNPGGITKRGLLSRIAKGTFRGKAIATNKYDYMRDLVAGWPDESTLTWCWFDDEQKHCEATFPDAASIKGATKLARRLEMIDAFKQRQLKMIVSKPRILGMGLNLQVATRQVFSSLIDSYERYFQAVCRSNRVGSTRPLNVHIPITEIEEPMVETVLRKAKRVEQDTREQEAIFKDSSIF